MVRFGLPALGFIVYFLSVHGLALFLLVKASSIGLGLGLGLGLSWSISMLAWYIGNSSTGWRGGYIYNLQGRKKIELAIWVGRHQMFLT